MGLEMKVDHPGLMRERLPSGAYRYRVRQKGNKRAKITLSVTPDHPAFMERYRAARDGVKLEPEASPADGAIPQSLAWLTYRFEDHMRRQVETGQMHPSTCQQRSAFYARLRAQYGDKHMTMPRSTVVQIRDDLAKTPGAANNMVKAIRALYKWAEVKDNPAAGVRPLKAGRGAKPWSIDDLRQFRECHPKGTMAHLALSIFMFTACRLGDAYRLGRSHEMAERGVRYLQWQPEKAGSLMVTVPMAPPLVSAIEAQTIVGPTYILNGWGRPFASKEAFGKWFRNRVLEAGLDDRSPHGIRKAAGHLLALEGASQHHIMAIHGHAEARTSEVYTEGVNRQHLAEQAMAKLADMEW